MREVQSQQKEAQRCERQGDCTQRPCEPCGGAVAYPTDSSTLFPCPFCHNTTLQHYPLPSVTTNVTKIALSESGKTASPEILLRNEAMYACVVETGRGFFEGVCAACHCPRISSDPPHPSIRELTLVHIRPRCQSPVLAMVSLNSCSESAGLLRWIILWQSAHSTVTPPILVRSCSDHSNSGRSERGSRWCTSM